MDPARLFLVSLCAFVLSTAAGCGEGDRDPAASRPAPASSPEARAPAPIGAARAAAPRAAEPARVPKARPTPSRRRGHLRFHGPDALAGARLRTPVAAGVAFDLDSGRVLWRRSARRSLPIASLTKVMTALLVVGSTRPRDVVRVPAAAWTVRGSRMGDLRPGRRVRVEALLHGLLMSSGNDAAVALAVHVAGSERAFVRRMNARARRMGLTCTRFFTPHGLGSGRIYGRGARTVACPADLGELAAVAMAQPRIAAVVGKRAARVRVGSAGLRTLVTTNPLLRAGRPGVIGLKTGWTPRAGRCLIAVARRDGRRIVVVLLRAGDPGAATERLLAAARTRSA